MLQRFNYYVNVAFPNLSAILSQFKIVPSVCLSFFIVSFILTILYNKPKHRARTTTTIRISRCRPMSLITLYIIIVLILCFISARTKSNIANDNKAFLCHIYTYCKKYKEGLSECEYHFQNSIKTDKLHFIYILDIQNPSYTPFAILFLPYTLLIYSSSFSAFSLHYFGIAPKY